MSRRSSYWRKQTNISRKKAYAVQSGKGTAAGRCECGHTIYWHGGGEGRQLRCLQCPCNSFVQARRGT